MIGRFANTTTCTGTPAIPDPIVTQSGTENVKLISTNIKNIVLADGAYTGQLEVVLESTKQVLGSNRKILKIPVVVNTTVTGGGIVAFNGCSLSATGTVTGVQEFTLIANTTDGIINPYGANGNRYSQVGKESHSNEVLYKKLDIPGTFSFCALSGYRTTADDSDMYDSCFVKRQTDGSWTIESQHHRDNTVQCRATCINI
jgi:hypothetical protein